MKRQLTIIVAALAVMFAGCSGNEGQPEDKAALSVTPAESSVEGLGGPVRLTVVSSSDWVVSSGAAWAKPSKSQGEKCPGGETLVVNIEANEATSPRNTSIKVRNLDGESVSVTINQDASSGDLTGPRGISSAEDLVAFAEDYNAARSVGRFMTNGTVVLLSDIDCSSIKEWIPVGTDEIPFTGAFDGKGHKLTGVNWTSDLSVSRYSGLFGNVKSATIQSLVLGEKGDRITVKGTAAADAFVGTAAGYASSLTMTEFTNNTSVNVTGAAASGKELNAGGLAGYADGTCKFGASNVYGVCVNNGDLTVASGNAGGFAGRMYGTVENCTNNGNVIELAAGGRAAGFVAWNEGVVTGCTNNGCILAPASASAGAAWGCTHNKSADGFTVNKGYGHVGTLDFRNDPAKASVAHFFNAMCDPAKNGFDTETTTVDWTAEEYYDWTVVESMSPASGFTYTHYNCTSVPRHVHVFEVDLSNPGIEIDMAFANECVPNPNGNGNSNNGFKIRETLSQLCNRRRSEGKNVLGGMNSGFFDSNDGISRGFNVERGEPVYINNPSVVSSLTNHAWGFTVFADGTASCGKKVFSGKFTAAGNTYTYCSVNDTILRHTSAAYSANLFTSRYKQYPHSDHKELVNKLAPNALYVIAEYTSDVMRVNAGDAEAVVKSIHDGRSKALSTLPYITADNQVGIALSGSVAEALSSKLKVGDRISLRCDIAIDGDKSKPIACQVSSMYKLMTDGKDDSNSPGSSASLYSVYDPMTFPVVSQDGKKVWLVEVDGRQPWYSMGVKGYEMYRIAKKLGGWNVTRLDGGGSSTVWVYNPSKSKGSLVNSVSDSKGERSCLSYVLINAK